MPDEKDGRLSQRGTAFATTTFLTTVVGFALVVWLVMRSITPASLPHTLNLPPECANPREQSAASCLRGARFAVEGRRWHEASQYLNQLRNRYANTELFTRQREQVDALARALEAGIEDEPRTAESPDTPGFFGGTLRVLPDGRVELSYTFDEPTELRDWNAAAGPAARLAEGRLEYGGPKGSFVVHVAPFTGDIEIAGAYRILESLDSYCDCSVNFCNANGKYYAVSLAPWEDKIFKGTGEKKHDLFRQSVQRAIDEDHTFRVVRAGPKITVHVDGELRGEGSDEELTSGSIGLGAWCSRTAFLELRITGRLEPQWLQANPAAAAQD